MDERIYRRKEGEADRQNDGSTEIALEEICVLL